MVFFVTISVVSPIFVSLSRPLQILVNNGMHNYMCSRTQSLIGMTNLLCINQGCTSKISYLHTGIDIGVKELEFGLYHILGAALVITGFLMLLVPNTLVNLEIRALIIKLRPGRQLPVVQEVELSTPAIKASR